VTLGVGFTRDARMSILPQAGVENGIADRVANFVGMTFTHGLGRKNVAARHEKKRGATSDGS
jgi:hypothetical protein